MGLRDLVKGAISPNQSLSFEKKTIDFAEYVETFINKCERFKLRSESTIAIYRQSFTHIKNYIAWENKGRLAYGVPPIVLSFDAITVDFYYGLTTYLWDVCKHNDNQVGKIVKVLKTFMNNAFEDGLHTSLDFKKKKFRKPQYETDEIYLNQEEINSIYAVNLDDSQRLRTFRDVFVVACWTGLRFGDVCRIQPEHIYQTQNGKFLKIQTEKTGEDVVIPFHPLVEAIYSIYNHKLPKIERNQSVQFNEALKEIAERAGIKGKVTIKNVVRGKAEYATYDKFKLVTAHTARRSFATNCYLMGIDSRTIMAITGHKTEKAFNKYIRISKDEHAKIMMEKFNTTTISVIRKTS